MAALEELKKKLSPLFDAEKGFSSSSSLDPNDSYLEKRQQLLTEIRTLCEAPCHEGLVDFHGAFYSADSGQISIALEYMDGGSLADMLKVTKKIPEPVLSSMFHRQFTNTFSLLIDISGLGYGKYESDLYTFQ